MGANANYVISIGCTMVIVLVVFLARSQSAEGRLFEHRLRIGRVIYWILVGAGFFLLLFSRFCQLGIVPGGVNQDEAMAAVDAYALSLYGTDRFGMSYPVHFTAWGYGQMSVMLSYLMIPFMKLLGLSVLAARLSMAIMSVLGAACLFLLAKELLGQGGGLIALYMTVINPWHFMQSRWALDCNMFPHFFMIALLVLAAGREKKILYYISMVFFGLCMYCYGVAFYMVPFFLLILGVYMLKTKMIRPIEGIGCAAVYFLVSWPIYLTMFINFKKLDTVHFYKLTMPYFPDSIRSRDILFFSEHMGQQLWSNLQSLSNIAVLQGGDLLWNALDHFGTLYWCSMPFVLLGLACTIREVCRREKGEKHFLYTAVLVYWICSILTGVLIADVNVNRINILFYAQLLLAVIGIDFVRRQNRKLLLPVCGVYLLMAFCFGKQYVQVYAKEIESYFFKDLIEAIEDSAKYESDSYCIAMSTEWDEAANCSEILTLFGQRIDPCYFQGERDEFMGSSVPYRERYTYQIPEEGAIREDTVYIMRMWQKERFVNKRFSIIDYGEFFMAVPEGMEGKSGQ